MITMIRNTCILLLVLAVPAFAWFTYSLEEPIDGLLSNSVTNITFDGTYVWVASGNGLAGSSDGGRTWITFNKDNAFTTSGVSALARIDGRLLIATADIDLNQTGGGLYYTEDFGANFQRVDNRQFSDFGDLSYDFAVFDSVVYSVNFNSGLLRSFDKGSTWRNVFIDRDLDTIFQRDSSFNASGYERGRYFSCAIDPHDSEFVSVWAGSAEGIQSMYYIDKRFKMGSMTINDIANDGDVWWYATDRGVSRFDDTLFTFRTFPDDYNFPHNYVSSITVKGSLVIAGLFDTLGETSLGFAISTDDGLNWEQTSPIVFDGANNKVEELGFQGDWIWAACDAAGLWRSTNDGLSWTKFYPPPVDTVFDPVFGSVHALDIAERDGLSRLSVGTDSGIVAFYFNDAGDLDSIIHLNLFDNPSYSQQVTSLSTFPTEFGDEYWAVVHPYKTGVNSTHAVVRSTNNGFTWDQHLTGPPAVISNDIEIAAHYTDTVVWVATEQGLRLTMDFGQRWEEPLAQDLISFDFINYGTKYRCLHIGEFEIHMGTAGSGLAQRYLALINNIIAPNFRIIKPVIDPNQFDFVERFYTNPGATPAADAPAGNFITAMAVQRSGDSSIVWAAVRPGLDRGLNGISHTTNRGATWTYSLPNSEVWNFEFNGDTVWAAANQGLYMTTDFGENWEKLSLRDQGTGRSISDSVFVYAVTLVEDELWVGTDDGIAITDIEDLEDWTVVRTFANVPVGETWVTPNPFSPYLGGSELKFHYKLNNPGNVTITIFDFANNVVKKVVDGVPREANVQYDDIDTWNGTNSRGDPVAGGVYIYLLESTGGDTRWGKIMVIP